jgi:hypothetical protein
MRSDQPTRKTHLEFGPAAGQCGMRGLLLLSLHHMAQINIVDWRKPLNSISSYRSMLSNSAGASSYL